MLQFILLAIIQGLTEFLPISSSGHLSLLSYLMNFQESNLLLLFLILHSGTSFAALYFFRKDIYNILLGLWDFVCRRKTANAEESIKWMLLIICISIPTAIVGILFKSTVETLGQSLLFLGGAWIFTAIVLIFTKWYSKNQGNIGEFTYKKAFLVGLAQSLAIAPGISRSGSTIAMAMFLGASPSFAGRLSFLASFVTIFGALLLEVLDLIKQEEIVALPVISVIVSFFVAFIVGLLALKFLMKLLTHGKLYMFSFYCFILGIFSFGLYFIKL